MQNTTPSDFLIFCSVDGWYPPPPLPVLPVPPPPLPVLPVPPPVLPPFFSSSSSFSSSIRPSPSPLFPLVLLLPSFLSAAYLQNGQTPPRVCAQTVAYGTACTFSQVYIFSLTGSLSPPESLDPFAFPADNSEDRVALDKSHPSLRLPLKQNQHKLQGVNKLLLIFPTNQTDGLRQLPRT